MFSRSRKEALYGGMTEEGTALEEARDLADEETAEAERGEETFLFTPLFLRPKEDAIFSRCDLHTAVLTATGEVITDVLGRILFRLCRVFCD